MARAFSYKGYDLEGLKKLSFEELKKIFPYQIRRRLNRGMELDRKIKRAIEENKAGNPPRNMVKTHKRDIIVLPEMVGIKFGVYDGHKFEPVEVKPNMIGYYLGDFVLTRKMIVHGKAGLGATRSSKNVGKK